MQELSEAKLEAHLPDRSSMLAVLGAPSCLTYTCGALVQALADVVYGHHALMQAMFVEDVQKAWAHLDPDDPQPVVLISDCPSKALVDLVLSARLPFLVVVEDFSETVHEVVEAREMPLAETFRFVTQSYCSLELGLGGDALVVTPHDAQRPLRSFLIQLAEHYRLDAPEDVAARTVARLGYADDASDTLMDHFVKSGLRVTSPTSRALRADAEGEALVRFMTSQYDGIGRGRTGETIVWPTSLFLDWDRMGLLNGPIEMLGPARFIICGPYLHLPPGDWVAEVIIEIAGNISGNRLAVDVFSGEIRAGVSMSLPSFGVYTFSIPFQVFDPFVPVELRFRLMEGAIEGRLALRSAALKKQGASGEAEGDPETAATRVEPFEDRL